MDEFLDGHAEALAEETDLKEFLERFGKHDFISDTHPRRRRDDNEIPNWCQICGVTKTGLKGLHN